nr:hypothetical protein [Tanacetum cinerariifolium]
GSIFSDLTQLDLLDLAVRVSLLYDESHWFKSNSRWRPGETGTPKETLHHATRFFRKALIQCQPLVKDLHGAEPFSPTCFGESLIRTKRVGVASSKQIPLALIDEKEIELESIKKNLTPDRSRSSILGRVKKCIHPVRGRCVKSSHVLGQVMALASFSLWDHLAFAGIRFPAAKSFTPFTE